jgi:hypothetical protein
MMAMKPKLDPLWVAIGYDPCTLTLAIVGFNPDRTKLLSDANERTKEEGFDGVIGLFQMMTDEFIDQLHVWIVAVCKVPPSEVGEVMRAIGAALDELVIQPNKARFEATNPNNAGKDVRG